MGNAVAVANGATAPNTASADVNYKSRLEWKMCVVSAVVTCENIHGCPLIIFLDEF